MKNQTQNQTHLDARTASRASALSRVAFARPGEPAFTIATHAIEVPRPAVRWRKRTKGQVSKVEHLFKLEG